MRAQNKIWRLIARKLAGEASAAELKELDKWILHYPDFGIYLQVLENSIPARHPIAGDFIQGLRKKIAATEPASANYLSNDKFCTRITLRGQSANSITFYLFLN